jgi:adenylosuccinate synthase
MDDKLARELLRMKKQAEEAAQEAYELKGRLSQIETTLKEEYQCQDLKEAQSLLSQLEEQAEELEQEIQEGLAEVKEEYEF